VGSLAGRNLTPELDDVSVDIVGCRVGARGKPTCDRYDFGNFGDRATLSV
jgi:hypothetical protein